jgi:hypothetical protein
MKPQIAGLTAVLASAVLFLIFYIFSTTTNNPTSSPDQTVASSGPPPPSTQDALREKRRVYEREHPEVIRYLHQLSEAVNDSGVGLKDVDFILQHGSGMKDAVVEYGLRNGAAECDEAGKTISAITAPAGVDASFITSVEQYAKDLQKIQEEVRDGLNSTSERDASISGSTIRGLVGACKNSQIALKREIGVYPSNR